ncbi:MAG TPA: heterodisulfide reductase-related iron-sulfur binding cluster [Afipia sp.]
MSDSKQKKEAPQNNNSLPSYAEHFGNIRVLGELMREPANRPWQTILPQSPEHHKYVVWLGCHVVRTAHLAETLDDLLNYLGEDFVTLGGPSNCCGITHEKRGDTEIGRNMLRQTSAKFDAFSPNAMLCWCPSCDQQLRTAPQEALSQTTKDRLSVAKFLSLKSENLTLNNIGAGSIALHWHGGTAEQEEDAEAVLKLLSFIPGLKVKALPAELELGRHCAEGNVAKYGTERYRAQILNSIGLARDAGATHLGSIYHSCHREMILAQQTLLPEQRMPVVNYLTLFAAALGLAEREDRYAHHAEIMDVERSLLELEPTIAQLKLNPAHAERALRANFLPKKIALS